MMTLQVAWVADLNKWNDSLIMTCETGLHVSLYPNRFVALKCINSINHLSTEKLPQDGRAYNVGVQTMWIFNDRQLMVNEARLCAAISISNTCTCTEHRSQWAHSDVRLK